MAETRGQLIGSKYRLLAVLGKGAEQKPFVLSPSKHEPLVAQLNRDLV